MSWLIFDDVVLAADAATETSHLVFDDATLSGVDTEVTDFVVFDAQGKIVERVEEEPNSFVVFAHDEQIILLTPGSPSLTLTTGQGPKGDPGPQGTPGQGRGSFVHDQVVSSDTWTWVHDLGYVPAVTIVDSAGNLIYGGQFLVLTTTTVMVHFSAAFSGTAYLS